METIGVGSSFLLFIVGIILTVITMQRMHSGKITLPGWAKILLSLAMIAMLAITLVSMLPPSVVHLVEDVFIDEATHIVTPVESVTAD